MNGHPTREEDFDLYALGALEGDEKRAIESHVATCESCAHRLAEARGRIALLALAAPPAAPSSAVKARLMSRIRAEGHGETGAFPSRAPESRGGFFGRWWAAVLVPVGVALLIAAIVLWNQNRRMDQQLAALAFRYGATAAGIAGSARSGRLGHGSGHHYRSAGLSTGNAQRRGSRDV